MRTPFEENRLAFLAEALAPVRERFLSELTIEDDAWKPFAKYRDDPVGFTRAIVGANPWDFSCVYMESIRDHPFTSVRAARGVSKTFTNAMTALWWMCTRRAIVLAFGAREDNIKNQLFAELGLWHQRARTPLPGRVDLMHWRLGPRHYMQGIATKSDLGAIGFHAGRVVPEDPNTDLSQEDLEKLYETAREAGKLDAELLVLADECPAIPDKILQALKGSIQGPHARLAMTGNPLMDIEQEHEFARSHRRGSRYRRIKVALEPSEDELDADVEFTRVPNWLATPDASGVRFIDSARKDWGEDDPRYLADVQARFSSVSLEAQFISPALLRSAELLEIPDLGTPACRHIGVDVSRQGQDLCVATLWINGVLAQTHEWKSDDLMASAGVVIELARRWGTEGKPVPSRNIHIDVGMGAGVIDRLKERGHQVDTVDFGKGPEGEWSELLGEAQFLNRKSELFWILRRALQEGQASIPAKYNRVRQELAWHTFELKARASGTVIAHAVSKDDLKEKYGRSPDYADSAVIAWSRMGVAPRIRTARNMRGIGRLLSGRGRVR